MDYIAIKITLCVQNLSLVLTIELIVEYRALFSVMCRTCWGLLAFFYFFSGVKCSVLFFYLQYLCECQFDENVKFKNAINDEDPDKMRLQPIGRDKDGQMYWFQLDQDSNVRVYLEEQDDLDGSSWKCVVR